MTAVLRPVRTPRTAPIGPVAEVPDPPGMAGQRPVEQRLARTMGGTRFGVVGLLAVVAFFAGLLVLANFHVVVIGDQFEFDRLERRLESGLEQAQVLRNEVARLESPDRILRVAEGRLGMVPPPERLQLNLVLSDDPESGLAVPIGDPFAAGDR